MWTAPRTWVTGEVVTSTIMNTHIRDNFNALLPVGSYIFRAAVATAVETTLEGRFLEANGVSVSRTTYADLFTYLNGLSPALPYGAGNGTTTYTLPDFRGRVPVSHNPTGPAEVNGLGDNDARAVTVRNISHNHDYNQPVTTINLGSSGGGNPFHPAATPSNTTGDVNNQDSPAYLVGGVWFIKYTS